MPGIADAKCVLIIGATSGIGRALALAIHALPSQPTVIVAGRRKERLAELAQQGFETAQLDMDAGRDTLRKFTEDTTTRYPDLDVVIFSAATQIVYNFQNPESVDLDDIEKEFNTNYLSIISLISFLLPHFLQRGEQGRPSFIVPITSNLAIVPHPGCPNYCATKAALHSLALTLDAQLRDTNVHVMEIFPPLTESELHGPRAAASTIAQLWLPLNEFTTQAMEGLQRGDLAIPVGRAAANWEKYEKGKSAQMPRVV